MIHDAEEAIMVINTIDKLTSDLVYRNRQLQPKDVRQLDNIQELLKDLKVFIDRRNYNG